jgi:hypothetical protein
MMNDAMPRTEWRAGLGFWIVLAAAALAVGLIGQGFFPRYELKPLDANTVFVFDRWTGAVQRATYGPDGDPRATAVLRPF